MIRAGIIGATGYTGAELVRILTSHEKAEITSITSRQYKGEIFSDIYPSFRKTADIKIDEYNPEKIGDTCDVVFMALPHEVPMKLVPELLERGLRVIDLSADFRFSSRKSYEDYYCPHESPEILNNSVYGLPEVYKDQIKNSFLVGNPGCYPTCSLLGLIPLLKSGAADFNDIIIDAKSGVSGAGRGLSYGSHFCEVNENFKAYKVAQHRHRPEIEEKIEKVCGGKSRITFTPHLIPAVRGMLATIYLKPFSDMAPENLKKLFVDFYKDSQFIRILPENEMPSIKNVAGTNYCDINLTYDTNSQRIIVVSVIDNLMKGASGQAVQNMNIMFDLEENLGLSNTALPV